MNQQVNDRQRRRDVAATSMLSHEVRYKLLKLLEPNPELSQREVARETAHFGWLVSCELLTDLEVERSFDRDCCQAARRPD